MPGFGKGIAMAGPYSERNGFESRGPVMGGFDVYIYKETNRAPGGYVSEKGEMIRANITYTFIIIVIIQYDNCHDGNLNRKF